MQTQEVIRLIEEDWEGQPDMLASLYMGAAAGGASITPIKYDIWLSAFLDMASLGRSTSSKERAATLKIASKLWAFVMYSTPPQVSVQKYVDEVLEEVRLYAPKTLTQDVRELIIERIIDKRRR